jgi:4-amino-4-deoxy-L-arabinose transferase-like glycosyltransferase
MKRNLNVHLTIVFLLAAGFLLRIYDLGAQSFWLDESISSIAAIALMEKGMPILPSGFMYSREILNTFLMASSFKIFGINEFAARLPSVLFGTLTILLVYIIGSKWGNKRIGIIAALLVTFSVWEIAWSRQARMYQQLQFFYILSLYLFYEFIQNRSLKNLALLALSFIGSVVSHAFGYALIPLFLLYLLILTLKERSNLRTINRKVIAQTALVFGILLGLAYYMGIIRSVLGTEINYYNIYIGLLKQDLGLFLFLAVPGGTVLVDRDWKKGTLLIAALIIPLYFIFFHVLLLGTRYLYFVIPILFILIGYFLDFVIDSMEKRLKAAANITVALLLIFAMYFSPAFTFTPKEKYSLGVNAPQSNFRDAYMYVKDNMQQDDVIVSAWTPPAQFYLGKSDYWLAFNVVGTGVERFLMNNSSRDVYTNATALSDVEGLKRVVDEHTRGWVIVDGVAWYKLRPGMRDFIRNNLTLYIASDKLDVVGVYGWQHGEN